MPRRMKGYPSLGTSCSITVHLLVRGVIISPWSPGTRGSVETLVNAITEITGPACDDEGAPSISVQPQDDEKRCFVDRIGTNIENYLAAGRVADRRQHNLSNDYPVAYGVLILFIATAWPFGLARYGHVRLSAPAFLLIKMRAGMVGNAIIDACVLRTSCEVTPS
jgi:hypothetical protein